jgi:hypothetical protein
MNGSPGSRLALLALLTASVVLGACTNDSGPDADDDKVSATPTPTESGSPTAPVSALAGAWTDVTGAAIGITADWTNKVELADVDLDGDVDLLFANGGDYDAPGTPVASQVFLNDGQGTFKDATRQVFGGIKALARVVKVADLNADGAPDIVLGTTYDTQSRLLLGDGKGGFDDATRGNLPTEKLSVGDLEVGDVDADGDLDLVLADWGDGDPRGKGGRTRLWTNDGTGRFSDTTQDHMPKRLVQFSWDLELVDVDNDWDLDLAISCKTCSTSLLFTNRDGTFKDVTTTQMPGFGNNYEFAPLDLDGDGSLDLVTINDGSDTANGPAEHVYRNTGDGTFENVTTTWWPEQSNAGWDDNVVVGLDVESDGDADFLIGSLDGPDRLLVNDGVGHLSLEDTVFDGDPTDGTLGMAVADLNGDNRLDVVQAQGEAEYFLDERVYFATDAVAPDTAAPIVRAQIGDGQVLARIHDNRTPNMPETWKQVVATWRGGKQVMTWYGENLFRADLPPSATGVRVCATDRAGNRTCTET